MCSCDSYGALVVSQFENKHCAPIGCDGGKRLVLVSLNDLEDLLEFHHELPVGLLQVVPEVLLAHVDCRAADLETEGKKYLLPL